MSTGTPIIIISTISAREALHDIAPEFEKASGYKVDVTRALVKRALTAVMS